ncbi:hypothetical protein [Spirosoma sordidisoli]|uniref:Uncharacterized protein n=1 Tax=Spirosoma sordidisoli TaxID=2502893 RepID=A0A4Q2UPT3_9BACT|nr:hypothetical protein [Spirosoma sordidisoli]RYC69620.1 hypothetical protein EQG79_13535 [Spirosoma sordidisoli]
MTPITPGFAPNPNSAPSPTLAAALMPTENLAQRRADQQAGLYFQSQLNEVWRQQNAERQAAIVDLEKTNNQIGSMGLLGPDASRLYNQFAEPWRRKVEDIIKNEYQGDVRRFRREKGDYLMGEFNTMLTTSRELQQAQQNKTNYALWLKDKQDGKLALGDMDTAFAQFTNGDRPDLPYAGGYEPPKNVFDRIAKGTKPGYEWGLSVKDERGNHIGYAPVPASREDIYREALNDGLSPAQASDYVDNKLRYQGGVNWGMKQPDPYKLRQDAIENEQWKMKFNQAERFQAQDIGERRADRAAREKARKEEAAAKAKVPGAGLPSYYDRLFSTTGFNERFQVPGQSGLSFPQRSGIVAGERDALLAALGYDDKNARELTNADNPAIPQDKPIKVNAVTPGQVMYRVGGGQTVTGPAVISADGSKVIPMKDGILREVTEIDPSRIIQLPAARFGGPAGVPIMAVKAKVNLKAADGTTKFNQDVFIPVSTSMNTRAGLTDLTPFGSPNPRAAAMQPTGYDGPDQPTTRTYVQQLLNED